MSLEDSPVWQAHRRRLLIGSLFALLAATLYGGNVPAARAASLAGMKGADVIFYRAVLLVVLAFIAAKLTGTRLRLEPTERLPMAILAIGASLTALCYLTAIDDMPVPMAVIIFYTFPLQIMLATPFIERRPLGLKLVILFAIAFVGLVMAIGPSAETLSVRGVAFALVAALCNACLFFFVGRASAAPLRSMVYVQAVMAPMALVFAFAQGGLAPLATFWAAPLAILAVIIGYALGFMFQMKAAQSVAPARMGLLFLAEPVTSILVAFFLLNETLAPLQFVGVALILGVLAAEILIDRD